MTTQMGEPTAMTIYTQDRWERHSQRGSQNKQ